MSDAMIGLVGGLVGVVIGFVLEVVRSWWSDRHESKEQAKAVRTIIQCELKHNMEVLRRFEYQSKSFYQAESKTRAFNYRKAFTSPGFSYKVWESQLSLVGAFLTESKLQQLFEFYDYLGHLDSLQLKSVEADINSAMWLSLVNCMYSDVQKLIERGCPSLVELPKTNQ